MDLSSAVSAATRARLRARFGATVDVWWESLPGKLETLVSRWGLVLGDPVGRGNTSLVVRCRFSQGGAAILKLTPDTGMTRGEARALDSWSSSRRVPELWAHDDDLGALLLEFIPNDAPLAESGSGVDTREVAELMNALHQTGSAVVGGGVVPLSERVDFMFALWAARWGASITTTDEEIAIDQVERGYDLAKRLAREQAAPVLLHGDLHPSNVLDGGARRGLVAIDPRPCVGDAAFDAVDWVFWPEDGPEHWRPRCERLARDLGLDGERIWDWCRTFAAMLAMTQAPHGGDPARVEAFRAMAP